MTVDADNATSSKQLIEDLYSAVLGRPADHDGLAFYTKMLQETGFRSVFRSLVESDEYRILKQRPATPAIASDIGRFGTAPWLRIDADVSDDVCERLLRHTARTWQMLGTTEPHWSVLTADQFRQEKLNEREFYATGATDLELLQAFFSRARRDLRSVRRVLELGCGVGRFTEHLSACVSHIEAVDVSRAHLEVAKRRSAECSLPNVTHRQLTTVSDLDSVPEVDLLYCVIVLQHNPPPVMKLILKKALSRVSPGGFAYFQLPTYCKGYSFDALSFEVSPNEMEMHVLPQATVFSILSDLNYVTLEVQEDTWVGSPSVFLSNTFFVTRSR